MEPSAGGEMRPSLVARSMSRRRYGNVDETVDMADFGQLKNRGDKMVALDIIYLTYII